MTEATAGQTGKSPNRRELWDPGWLVIWTLWIVGTAIVVIGFLGTLLVVMFSSFGV
jgi:hypothetical protein